MLPAITSVQAQSQHRSPSRASGRRTASTSTKAHNSETLRTKRKPVPLTETLCLELLKGGHVQSYIDFFRTTIAQPSEHTESANDMLEYKGLLTNAENNQRNGNLKSIYESKKNVARFFQQHGKHEVAISHYWDSLKIAEQLKGDDAVEVEATRNLGQELESNGHVEESSKMYERSRRLARERSLTEAEHLAAKNLVSVRMRIAKQQEKQKNFADAIGQYKHCVQILEESCPDEATLNDLSYRLARAHQQNGDTAQAIELLENLLAKAQKPEGHLKLGWARAVLASCHESAGNLKAATECLLMFLRISEEENSPKSLQAQACNQLGNLYNKMGEYSLAVEYFERHYTLSSGASTAATAGPEVGAARNADLQNQIKSRASSAARDSRRRESAVEIAEAEVGGGVGVAEIQVGISRANAHMQQFLDLVKSEKNLHKLLKWKAQRSFEVFEGNEQGVV
ncbi:uncharacterized protein EV422DRAFT_579082 [Fimicolochytrium jonesii]|uniref:uncharacterized protein n=1 Tax=Fimicolochytrium jonesii TaxID=1396493 RepID=UPI0022FF3B7D|nr:uncharacterized protein EV422DRAFT_579082 [Fimicolochytrium jonesii]KAI8819863.1 hypothetical protein EV422DRAFT_579082 [Fimicolochytrium jonesii]